MRSAIFVAAVACLALSSAACSSTSAAGNPLSPSQTSTTTLTTTPAVTAAVGATALLTVQTDFGSGIFFSWTTIDNGVQNSHRVGSDATLSVATQVPVNTPIEVYVYRINSPIRQELRVTIAADTVIYVDEILDAFR